MTRQLIQSDSSNIEIGIPRVIRLHAFIAARFGFHAHQSVMFDVVDALQKEEGDHPHKPRKQHNIPGKNEVDRREVCRLDEVVPKHVILDGNKRLVLSFEQLKLQLPRADVLPGNGGNPKPIDGLIVASGSAIFRGCHIEVVTEIMLDVEMHVQARHVQTFADEPVYVCLSMPQFMRHIDAVRGQEDPAGYR